MHLKRYFKMCNMFVLFLLLMMGGGRRIEDTVDIGSVGSRRKRERREEPALPEPLGMTTPVNEDVRSPKSRRASLMNIISPEAPFPLPTADLGSRTELGSATSSERDNSRVKVLTEAKT